MSRIKSGIQGVLKAVGRDCGKKSSNINTMAREDLANAVDCLMKRLEIYLLVLESVGVTKIAEIRTKTTAEAVGKYLNAIITSNEKDRLLFANALLKYAKHEDNCLANRDENTRYSESTCTCGLITYQIAARKAVLNPAGIPVQLLQ